MFVDADFDARFDAFLKAIQTLEDNHHNTNFPNLQPTTFEFEAGSKFIRVWRCSHGSKSAHCFVAMKDDTTKILGTVKKGDIMKPATWKQPAKYARGNIFAADYGMSGMGVYGPSYLRG